MSGVLYKRFWRWHFWAALLVVPFLLLQTITGTLYVWQNEWADAFHADSRFVAVKGQPLPLDQQSDAAFAAVMGEVAGAKALTLIVPEDPNRSTTLVFAAPNGLEFPAFIHPYTGDVLAVLSPWQWLPGWSRALHGGWPFGDAGSWFLELGACWCIVMILTGLYLWWPRGLSLARALIPRSGLGARVWWRDLHACAAVWVSILTLAFLFTALPWTKFWGDNVLKPIQKAFNQQGPFGGKPLKSTGSGLSLDAAYAQARRLGMGGNVELRFDDEATSVLKIRNRQARASQEMQLSLDRANGTVLKQITWEDYKALPKAISTGVDLHEGTFFGRANQWLNTVLSMVLLWLCISGLVSWWVRQPNKPLAQKRAPAFIDQPLPAWVWALGLGLCLLLPLLGLSVLLLWGFDTLQQRLKATVS
jgi:uncharacterized iron-regulated membrane protein